MIARACLVALLLAGAFGAPGFAAEPKFDGAAALKHVERLVAIGPRVAGTPGGARSMASASVSSTAPPRRSGWMASRRWWPPAASSSP